MPDDGDSRLAVALLVVLALMIVGGYVLHAHLVYDDWTCAFSHCVKVK